MKKLLAVVMCAAVMLAPSFVNAATTADTPSHLQNFGDEPAPTIVDGVITITEAANSLNNWVAFDRSDAGSYGVSNFSFDLLLDPTDTGPSADGISISYANTANFGVDTPLDAAPFTPEDPAAAGVLGFGFDTWSNQGAWDNPDVGTGSDYSEVSVFYDGALIARIDDTRLLDTPLTLDDGQLHSVTGNVDFSGATVSLMVDGNPLFSDLNIPGLAPFESRILLAGRTGGENELAQVQNLNVEFVPEPSTGLLAVICAAASLGFIRRRFNG